MAEPIHILFVDDDLISLAIAERTLRHERHCLTCANTPADAIRLLNTLSFDVAIGDIFMPQVDGYELIRHVRRQAEHYDLLIIAASVRNGPDVRQNALNAGADTFLQKPLDWAKVVEILRRIDPTAKRSSTAAAGCHAADVQT